MKKPLGVITIDVFDKNIDDFGVELRAGIVFQPPDNFIFGEGVPVEPFGSHRIKRICNAYNPRAQGDVLPL